MIISCPTCGTRYTVGANSVPPEGRKVRCAKCGNTWQQFPIAEIPDTPTAIFDDFEAPTEIRPVRPPPSSRTDRLKTDAPPPRARGKKRTIGWALFGIATAAILGGLVWGRGFVAVLWPPSLLLYQTIGLAIEPPGAGLQLPPPHAELKTGEGASILLLDGQITNPSDRERRVPKLRVIPRGGDGAPLESWSIEPSHKALLPGEIATYHDEHPVPGTVAEITVTFF